MSWSSVEGASRIVIRPAGSERELAEILALQRENLARSLDAKEMAGQGFVTVEHTLEALRRMHAIRPRASSPRTAMRWQVTRW